MVGAAVDVRIVEDTSDVASTRTEVAVNGATTQQHSCTTVGYPRAVDVQGWTYDQASLNPPPARAPGTAMSPPRGYPAAPGSPSTTPGTAPPARITTPTAARRARRFQLCHMLLHRLVRMPGFGYDRRIPCCGIPPPPAAETGTKAIDRGETGVNPPHTWTGVHSAEQVVRRRELLPSFANNPRPSSLMRMRGARRGRLSTCGTMLWCGLRPIAIR